jgi:hypothetical protein
MRHATRWGKLIRAVNVAKLWQVPRQVRYPGVPRAGPGAAHMPLRISLTGGPSEPQLEAEPVDRELIRARRASRGLFLSSCSAGPFPPPLRYPLGIAALAESANTLLGLVRLE